MDQNDTIRTPLHTRRITDFETIRYLYKSRLKKDFARNELKPLSSMQRLWQEDAYDCYGLFDDDEILGYAFFVRRGKNYLFDYLAVEENRRDEGLGSIFLRQLAACMADADCVVGEVEDPDQAKDEAAHALRERRLQFYLRNGYQKTELTSVVFGADYRILEVPVGKIHTTDELRTIYTGLYQSIFPALIFKTQFRTN